MEVGNFCVHQFLGLSTKPIFDGLRRVVKDHSNSLGYAAMMHFLKCGWMSDWEHDFYSSTLTKQKRSMTERQMNKRIQINEKMLRMVHNRGLDQSKGDRA
jgi:hypothetical protein